MNIRENHFYIFNNEIKRADTFIPSSLTDDVIIYEVIRLIDGKILFIEEHLERFFKSLHYAEIEYFTSVNEILNQLGSLITSNKIKNGNIKFQLTINKAKDTADFMAFFIPHSYPTEVQYQKGVPVSIAQALRDNPNAKIQQNTLRASINKIIDEQKVYEVILVHPQDYITECSRSNLFMIKDNEVLSAQIVDILPGITLKHIFQICNNLNLSIKEKRISQKELFSMDALFLTGTSPKVLPISAVLGKQFDVNHPILRRIMKEFDERLKNYLEQSRKFL
jgi:branched-chain amino acid aminotransferase